MNNNLISKQMALDALDQIFDRCEEIEAHLPEGDPDRTGYKMYPDYMTVWKYLHRLPSAERGTGRWIFPHGTTSMVSICSECGAHGRGNFCPNCGAKMEENNEDD